MSHYSNFNHCMVGKFKIKKTNETTEEVVRGTPTRILWADVNKDTPWCCDNDCQALKKTSDYECSPTGFALFQIYKTDFGFSDSLVVDCVPSD